MKRAFCLLMATAYIFGCMGFGIHTCLDDGSRHFVWMMGDVSCEHIHHSAGMGHGHCDSAGDHDHHAHGCCSTHVYVLSDAQDNVPDSAAPDAPESPVFTVTETAMSAAVSTDHSEQAEGKSPPLLRPLSRSFLSVWRV